jgi:pimeloyl-ACP methyl ester carboxylesterase
MVKWVVRIFGGIVAFIVIVIFAGCAYQALAESNDARAYPPPGQLLDVGGYKLHLYCIGNGAPTVILDAAFPAQVSNWVWVQPQIAKTTRVCAYDRAGHGWSDLGSEPRDAKQQARELKTLLEKANEKGPFVLVGHSLGGLYAREFTDMYPDQVAGMVLIESSHPDSWKRQNMTEGVGADAGMLNVAPMLARVGFFRAGLFPVPKADAALPELQRNEEQAYFNSVKYFENLRAVNNSFSAALQQVRETKDIGSKPLAIVVGAASENFQGVARELQEDLLKLSTNSAFISVDGATHSGLVDDERFADETANAILKIVEAARNKE